MDYTTLSLAEVRTGLEGMARETQAAFGSFDARQLNWRPDAARWSVAQCFEHLLTANRLMFQAAEAALADARPMSGNGYKVQVAKTALRRAILKATGAKVV